MMIAILKFVFAIGFVTFVVLGITNVLIMPHSKLLSKICTFISIFNATISLGIFIISYMENVVDISWILLIFPFTVSDVFFYANVK